MPTLTDIEAAEMLKPHLGEASNEELQAILDAAKKPHDLQISKRFLKRINAILKSSVDTDDD
jgi:hypothetical protein